MEVNVAEESMYNFVYVLYLVFSDLRPFFFS